jgi:hypothetical protein
VSNRYTVIKKGYVQYVWRGGAESKKVLTRKRKKTSPKTRISSCWFCGSGVGVGVIWEGPDATCLLVEGLGFTTQAPRALHILRTPKPRCRTFTSPMG